MIEIDRITASALEVACLEYLAGLELRDATETRNILIHVVSDDAIAVPAGADDRLRETYFAIADTADKLAAAAPSTSDELAMRRASAAIRQAGRLIVQSSRTRRIPVISDREASERLRKGLHNDHAVPLHVEAAPTRPMRAPTVEVDDAPVDPIEDEPSIPVVTFDLGGES